MRRIDIERLYQLSHAAFDKLVDLGVITTEQPRDYQTPWEEMQLFKPADVASFLTRMGNKHWSISQIMYQWRSLFFDLHMDKCDRALYRITVNDFHSLVCSVDKDFGVLFERHFNLKLEKR